MHIQSHITSAMPWARRSLIFLAACALWPLFATLAHADAVTDWNQTAIRTAASIGISTGWQSRIVAIAHAAMADAVNSIERQYTTYAVEVSPPVGASAEAAAITAAHAVLMHLVPDQKNVLDAALTTTLANVADGAAKDAGADSQIACWYWKYRFNFWRQGKSLYAQESPHSLARACVESATRKMAELPAHR